MKWSLRSADPLRQRSRAVRTRPWCSSRNAGSFQRASRTRRRLRRERWYTLLNSRLVSARTTALTNRFSPSAIASLTMRLAIAVCAASSWLSIYPGRRSAVAVGPQLLLEGEAEVFGHLGGDYEDSTVASPVNCGSWKEPQEGHRRRPGERGTNLSRTGGASPLEADLTYQLSRVTLSPEQPSLLGLAAPASSSRMRSMYSRSASPTREQ